MGKRHLCKGCGALLKVPRDGQRSRALAYHLTANSYCCMQIRDLGNEVGLFKDSDGLRREIILDSLHFELIHDHALAVVYGVSIEGYRQEFGRFKELSEAAEKVVGMLAEAGG